MSSAKLENSILAAIKAEMSRKVGPVGGVKKSKAKAVAKSYTSPSFALDPTQAVALKELLKGVTHLDSARGAIEIEAIVGNYVNIGGNTIFFPGLKTAQRYNEVLERLSGEVATHEEISERVRIISSINLREMTPLGGGDVTYQTKTTQWKRNVNDERWGIRIKKSYESPKDVDDFDEQWEAEVLVAQTVGSTVTGKRNKGKIVGVIRDRVRHSYRDFLETSPFKGFKLDITDVREQLFFSSGSREVKHRYEMEMELFSPALLDDMYKDFMVATTALLVLSQGVSDDSLLIDDRESRELVIAHNRFLRDSSRARRYDPNRLDNSYLNKPRNLKLGNMLDKLFANSYVTVKYDGARKQLWSSATGTYLLSPPYDIVKISTEPLLEGGIYLFDTELQGEDIYVFDMILANSKRVTSDTFARRYAIYSDVLNGIDRVGEYALWQKEYFTEGSIYNRTNDALHDIATTLENDPDLEGYEDGLIFQPSTSMGYYNSSTYKWKPADKMSIDFFLIKVTPDKIADAITAVAERADDTVDNGDWIVDLHDDTDTLYTINVGERGGRLGQFTGAGRSRVTGYFLSDSDDEYDGKVVEMYFDKDESSFKVYRVRYDRTRPNNDDTARSVWMDIVNPIAESTIRGVDMKLLRRYHNMYKRTALNRNFKHGSSILDIGSGRGGDLSKWRDAKIKKVYAIEPNNENLEEFVRRYESGGYNRSLAIEFMNHGAEHHKTIAKVLAADGVELDGVVSFFSLTFFFKRKEKFDRLLETIALLPPRAKFVGSVMDGGRVRELLKPSYDKLLADEIERLGIEGDKKLRKRILKESKLYSESYEAINADDRTMWSITREGEFTDDPFGNTITIDIDDEGGMVKKQREWLVDFAYLKKALERKGFYITFDSFLDHGDSYDTLPVVSQEFSRLNRTFVFQKKV